jgi:hypothetical protein
MILSTLLSAKTAAAAVGAGALVLGGGTVAAYAGVLPTSLQDVAHVVVGAPAPEDQVAATGSPDPSTSAEPSEPADASEAPDPSESPEPSESPKAAGTADSPAASAAAATAGVRGPDATGPAAFGLCTAHTHGGLPEHSTAYQALAAAAAAAAAAIAPAPTGSAPAGTAPAAPTATQGADPAAAVDAYCRSVLDPTGAASPAATAAPSASPSADTAAPTPKHGQTKAKANHKHKTKTKAEHGAHPNRGQGGAH